MVSTPLRLFKSWFSSGKSKSTQHRRHDSTTTLTEAREDNAVASRNGSRRSSAPVERDIAPFQPSQKGRKQSSRSGEDDGTASSASVCQITHVEGFVLHSGLRTPTLQLRSGSDSSLWRNVRRGHGWALPTLYAKRAAAKPTEGTGEAFMHLPNEIWMRIVSYIADLDNFSKTSKASHTLLGNPHVRRACLYGKYGIRLSLYLSYVRHRRLLDPELVSLLFRGGARIPRFMVQQITNEQQRDGLPLTAVQQRIMEEAKMYYAHNHDFSAEDDILTFEYLTNDLLRNLPAIRDLITRYHFVPLESITPTATFRLSQLIQTDITLLDTLIEANGLWPSLINDSLIGHLMTSCSAHSSSATEPASEKSVGSMLEPYLARGFTLTSPVVLSQMRNNPTPQVLSILQRHVSPSVLLGASTQVLADHLGPSTTAFSPTVVENIASTSRISDAVLRTILFHPTNALPYRTRCYEQQYPIPAWKWMVQHFGPSHKFAKAAFDDLIVWINDVGEIGLASGGASTLKSRPHLPHRSHSSAAATARTSMDQRPPSAMLGYMYRTSNTSAVNIAAASNALKQSTIGNSQIIGDLVLEFMDLGCALEPHHFRAGPSSSSTLAPSLLYALPAAAVARQAAMIREAQSVPVMAQWIAVLNALEPLPRRMSISPHPRRHSISVASASGTSLPLSAAAPLSSDSNANAAAGPTFPSLSSPYSNPNSMDPLRDAISVLRSTILAVSGSNGPDYRNEIGVGIPVTTRAKTWDVGQTQSDMGKRRWSGWLKGKF
ncbi:uncharacterized protein EV422DRAFT_198496 [Fimicolochytrium jonesii]|uniref:uncharacterized protein n=1 Tax=Fimicolochytrium jonesii TaxID=1396493 RepID=UPI0022FEF545|nr:uncharacterized protein EV422DRAFT_198496 [Fimicolochytrium jonesii]KAI8817920.1 hypothetical protein EV422DRAFT_198496 [Fimicolochytrium jonesii]